MLRSKIFMGDTGSLSLGGSLAAIAIIVKHEIVLAIIGGLFVLETVSVIIQWFHSNLQERIFKMAQIHIILKKRLGRINNSNSFLDNSNNFSFSRSCNFKIKVKNAPSRKTQRTIVPFYGLGLSGQSVGKFFKKIKLEIFMFGMIRKKIYLKI